MNSQKPEDPHDAIERFFTVINSLNQFDTAEIRPMLESLIGEKSRRENCVLGNYYRAIANIDTLLTLKHIKHLQAIAMLARGLFEIAVESRLLRQTPDAEEKIIAFSDLELLRLCRRLVEFEKKRPHSIPNISISEDYISKNKSRIDGLCKALWPETKAADIKHWSLKNLSDRAEHIGSPFDRIYAEHYATLSWYSHSGLTGFLNVTKATYLMLAGLIFALVSEAYTSIMEDAIAEFKINHSNEKIHRMMTLAKMLPFTNGPDDVAALQMLLLG